jgi:hypothetical protein
LFDSELNTSHEEPTETDLPSPIYSDTEDDVGVDEVEGQLIDTNKFLYGVLCACIVVQVWHRLWLLHLLPIPVVYYGIKKLCSNFGIGAYFRKKVREPFLKFYLDQGNEHSRKSMIFNSEILDDYVAYCSTPHKYMMGTHAFVTILTFVNEIATGDVICFYNEH